MSSIAARTTIACPLASGARLVAKYFAVHQKPDGGASVIQLTPNHSLKASVVVTVTRTHEAGEMTPHFRVVWTPVEVGRYPEFAGMLAVNADEDYNTCILELTGAYEPPLGIPGKIFDAVLGNQIAQATADHLLAAIREFVEHDVRLEEARKVAG